MHNDYIQIGWFLTISLVVSARLAECKSGWGSPNDLFLHVWYSGKGTRRSVGRPRFEREACFSDLLATWLLISYLILLSPHFSIYKIDNNISHRRFLWQLHDIIYYEKSSTVPDILWNLNTYPCSSSFII